jgi:hypothetical protein
MLMMYAREMGVSRLVLVLLLFVAGWFGSLVVASEEVLLEERAAPSASASHGIR